MKRIVVPAALVALVALAAACPSPPAEPPASTTLPSATPRSVDASPTVDAMVLTVDASIPDVATVDASDASIVDAAPDVTRSIPGLRTSTVPCKTTDDCWSEGATPIARPKALRGRKYRPCVDGEHQPMCTPSGVCATLAFGC